MTESAESSPPAALPANLANFANSDGRITRLPVKLGRKVELAHWLLEQVDLNRTYTEPELNDLFLTWVDDFALMRRILAEEGSLIRDRYGREYRRAKPKVEVPPGVPFADLTSEQQVATLEPLVSKIAANYPLELVGHELLNHAFNTTFRLDTADGTKYALRINVNSDRTPANLAAEIAYVRAIRSVKVPEPLASIGGGYVTEVWHEATGRKLPAVIYSWLEGEELAENPTDAGLRAAGVAMAKLHLETADFNLPAEAELPLLDDVFWGLKSHFTPENEKLDAEQLSLIQLGLDAAQEIYTAQFNTGRPQVIHADMHGWNLMWNETAQDLAVFDFDDSAIGTPLQDLATALYYLEPEEREVWREGYASVAPLPACTDADWETLLLHRRLFLLNYIFETHDQEAKALLPKYLEETIRRLKVWSENRA